VKLTDDQIEGVIVSEEYTHVLGTTATICILVLENGFVCIGTSACVIPKDYDETMGRLLARDNAKDKVWELEGYLLKQKMHEGVITTPSSSTSK
jgi:hypothetical protein